MNMTKKSVVYLQLINEPFAQYLPCALRHAWLNLEGNICF